MNNKLQERWYEGTNELIKKLESREINFEKLDAIELFGRDGSWQTIKFAKKVKSIEIWEIESKWENELKKKLPNATIKIRDSVSTLKLENELPKFDLILIDNPMNVYNNEQKISDRYCEHFEILQNIQKLAKNNVLIIFNVNRKPFDYEKYPLWKQRRQKFYGNIDTSAMEIKFLLNFYEKKFCEMGFETVFCINVVRVLYQGDDMTHYFAYKLKKI